MPPTPALIEMTFTPKGDRTTVKVEGSGVGADATCYPQLGPHHLDRIAAALAGAEPDALPGT